ncbi:MAG: hypothetical protein PUG09_07550 [Prevotella sp.]|nr:hypothetical protein [Prevotella sp.]
MKRIYTIFLLSVLCLSLTAQSKSIKYWEFNINGKDGVPCRFYGQSNMLFLSGFDVSTNDRFYFAGGEPLQLACFDGKSRVFNQRLDDKGTTTAMMKLIGDSVYIFNNRSLTLYRLHRNGTGAIGKSTISLENFSPRCGTITDSDIIVVQKRGPIGVNQSTYVYPGYDVLHFDLSGRFKRWTWLGSEGPIGSVYNGDEMVKHYLYSPMQPKLKDFTGDYKGEWQGHQVFWGMVPGGWAVVLTDSKGNVEKQHTINYGIDDMYKVIPMPVLTDEIDAETAFTSPAYCLLRQHYLYLAGYSGAKGKIIVCRIDLPSLFPEVSTTGK